MQHHRVVLKEIKIFEEVCMVFHFMPNSNLLMFAKKDCLFTLDFKTKKTEEVFKFSGLAV